ncbi:MAG: hypothetical protein L0154_28445, partial [Chloroflexi bacterium]|nr:hypothetical protein [Chloroflexota bacterium]
MNFQLQRISTTTLLFLSMIGGSVLWARAITLSLFVERLGTERLPLALALDGVLIVVIAVVYAKLARQMEHPVLLWLVCLLVAALIFWGRRLDTSGIIILFIAGQIFSDIFSKYAQRHVAYFYASSHDREGFLESLLASRAVQGLMAIALIPMSLIYSPGQLINWWLGTVLLSVLLVMWVSGSLRYVQKTVDTLPEYGDENPRFKSAGHLIGLFTGRLIRWLTIMALAVSVISTLLLYQTLVTLEQRFDNFVALITFFSLVNGVGIWLSLPLKYIALSRLLRQLNAGRLTALFPAAAAGTFWALMLVPSLLTAGLGEFARTALRVSFYEPLERILHHALPGGVEGWSKRFIDSYIEPAGHIVGALILFSVIEAGSGGNELLFVIGTGVAVILIISAERTGHHYGIALSSSLEAGQYRVLRHAAGEWGP